MIFNERSSPTPQHSDLELKIHLYHFLACRSEGQNIWIDAKLEVLKNAKAYWPVLWVVNLAFEPAKDLHSIP